MKKIIFSISILAAFSCNQREEFSFSKEVGKLEWIDLSHSFDSSTLYWPNNPTGFVHHTDAEGVTPLGYYYSSYTISTPEHGGTHLDAPIHFAANKLTIDELPLSSLMGDAIVIDVSKKALDNRDYLASIKDVEEWEEENGKIPDNTIVLFRTGYGKFYPDRMKYFGTAKTGVEAIPELHFPGIDPATTEWLVRNRNIKALGLDTPSMDYGQSKEFKTHQILLGSNKPGFENVANLDKLPLKGIYVMAFPMKIGKGSGGPLRIIAGVVKKD
ncbi:MAG: cyclase family protein [Chitinophagaceae bacterium]